MDDLDNAQTRLAAKISNLVYGASPPAAPADARAGLTALAGHARTLAGAPYKPGWGETQFRPSWLVDLPRRGHLDWHGDWCRMVASDPGRIGRVDGCCREAADRLEIAAADPDRRTEHLEAALMRLLAAHRQLPDPRYLYDTPLGFHPQDAVDLVLAAGALYRAWSDGAGRPPRGQRELLAEAWRRLRAQDPLAACDLVRDAEPWTGDWFTPLALTHCVA